MQKYLKKKTAKKILFGLIGLIALIYLMNFFNIDFGLFTIGTRDTLINSGTESFSFTCPTDATFCNIEGIMSCNVKETTEVQKVIFRYKGSNTIGLIDSYGSRPTAFVYAHSYGDGLYKKLEPYFDCGSVGSNTLFGGRTCLIMFKDGTCITQDTSSYTNSINLWSRPNSAYNYVPLSRASSTGGCMDSIKLAFLFNNQDDLSDKPQYNCKLPNEYCTGSFSDYECSGQLKFPTKAIQLTYSSANAGSKTSGQIKILPGEKVEISGGDSTQIKYQVYKTQNYCTQDFCNLEKAGYFKCVNEKPTEQFVSCNNLIGEVCDDSGITKCTLPISVKVDSVKSYSTEQNINVDVSVASKVYSSGSVTVYLKESSPKGTIKLSDTKSISFDGAKKRFTFNPIQYTGDYYVVAEVNIGKSDNLIYGDDVGETLYFSVAPEFSSELKIPYQTIAGKTNRQIVYTNYPVTFELITESGGAGISPDKVNVKITPNTQISLMSSSKGLNVYQFTPTTAGTYKIESETSWRGATRNSVTDTNVIFEDAVIYLDLTNPKEMQINLPSTFRFSVKDRANNLIDVDSIKLIVDEVSIEKDISSSVKKTSQGNYEFSYTPTKRGGYEFKISAVKSGLQDSALVKTGQIQSVEEAIKPQCSFDTDCGFFKECKSGNCQTKVTLLFTIIGIAVLFIIVVIVIISFLRRDREPVLF